MPKIGGARPGAGRPRGSVSRRSVEVVAEALASGMTPVEFMLAIMRDESAEPKRREWAAEKVAPYLHPRPTPIDATISMDLPDTSTAEGIEAAQAKVLATVAAGEITPSQGQSLSTLIEGRRRAIETGELLARIENLEARDK